MSNEKEKIQAGLAEYNASVEKTVARFPERGHLPEQRLYTPLDIEGTDYTEEIGFPGMYPYTRGVQPTMYRGRFWTMRMYAGFSTAEESNKRYRYLIESGATGLSCAFDLPTQIGYDSTDDISEGEVGKVGVAIDSLADMEILFDQIDLGKVSTSMTINAPASVLLAMYIAVAEKQGVPADQLKVQSRTIFLKNMLLVEHISSHHVHLCVLSLTSLNIALNMYQNGTQSPFLVTIFVKLVLLLLRKSHLLLLMVSLTLKQLSKLVLTLMLSQVVYPSSGMLITTYLKKLQNSVLPVVSGLKL